MKYFKWLVPACATVALTACSSMTADELRPKLAAANVEVTAKSTIKEIHFFTRSQEVGHGVANSGTGLVGALVGISIAAAGRVDSVPVDEGYSTAVAAQIKGRLAHTLPGVTENYRLEVTDGALFRTVDGSGQVYALNYAVALNAINLPDGKKLATIGCSGVAPERLSEQQWRESAALIRDIRKEVVSKCSGEFVTQLASAIETAKASQPRRKKKSNAA